MALDKKKRSLYNLFVGLGTKTVLMVLGFFIPRLTITNYGSEINGLLSSISQIFSYLALFEAGVGVATTQALYTPIAQNDNEQRNAIMSAASRFYQRTGILYGAGVLIFAVGYPFIINNSLQNSSVFMLIVLSGANGVINYFAQAKYLSLLNAEGKGYVHTAIGSGISILKEISKITLLSLKADIIVLYSVYFVVGIMQNLLILIYIKKNYKNLNCRSKPNYDALSQRNSVLVHQVSSLIFSNTDVLILSVFVNLQAVSIYGIYNLVVTSLNTVITIILGSFTAALGLTLQEDKERFKKYYDMFEFGTWTLCFCLMSVTYLLYTPFMRLYTKGADITYIDQYFPFMFVVVQLLSLIRMPAVNAVNVAGHFKKTQLRSVVESVINLFVSIVGVLFWGIYGVLFGTMVALMYRTIDLIIYTNKYIVRREWKTIGIRLLINILLFIAVLPLEHIVDEMVCSVPSFIVAGIIITLGIGVVYLAVNLIAKEGRDAFKTVVQKFWRGKVSINR